MSDGYVVSGRVYVEMDGDTLEDAIRRYREKFGNASPDQWERWGTDEGGLIIGWCENCAANIDDGEDYETDGEVRWHRVCLKREGTP